MRRQLNAADYELAESLLPLNRSGLVSCANLKFQWIDGGASFWYRREGPEGHSFVRVVPARRLKEPAFDHERLAAALASASGFDVRAAALPFRAIEYIDGAVEFDALGAHWRCSLETYRCEKVPGHASANPLEIRSPDKKWAVFQRGYDLWLRSLVTGQEDQLTSDGTADFSYGFSPDCLSFGALMQKFGLPHLPPFVAWSPDSRRVVTHRTDQRNIRLSHLIESSPPSGGPPVLHTYRYAFPGDEHLPSAHLVVFDTESRTAAFADTAPLPMPVTSPLMFGEVWWAPDGKSLYFLEKARGQKKLSLKRVDPVNGKTRTLVEESSEPRAIATQFDSAKPIVRVISNGEEILWYSQRDGWGHLYLYDATSGKLRNRVTSGNWAVQQILHVDETNRVVYFIASGLVETDLYRRQVCRANLDGTGFARLGHDDLDHIVSVPPGEAYYVDLASSTQDPPVFTLRNWRDESALELERADISRLRATGWRAPERFCLKAADGKTDIYGVLYHPHNLDPHRKYPVIDHPYPGPQTNRVQPSFGEMKGLYDAEALAALGFAVVAVDGRGTPGRDRAFLDLSYGHLDKAGFLEDHIVAIRELARTRPWMDLDRVGIFGSSGGGFATVRAMCTYPDFYKVGVSLCGNHDQRFYQLSWGETHLGDPRKDPDAYVRASNVEIADRLEGKLLLIHGEMDDNVHPHLTMRLVDRLIAANKDFELLIVPGAEHIFVGHLAYVTRRRWDFFVRHLLGAEPPANYRLTETQPSFDALFG